MTDRELMQQALDVLKIFIDGGNSDWARKIEALRDRLAQPEQEPVWVEVTTNTGDKFILDSAVEADKIRAARDAGLSVVPLYTAPPQRDEAPAKAVEWQGLTDEELHLQAAAYASRRKNAYLEGMKQGEVDHMSEEALNGKWLAHYEGYREGYWVATGDDRYTTDPAKEHKRGKNT